MEESILVSIKKMLGIDKDNTDFDTDIMISINSVLSILTQMGVGPETGFTITGTMETWRQLLNDVATLNLVQSYVFLKVKLIFDPPQSSSVIGSNERLITELEYRITATTGNSLT